jgi:PAS domain S-box-containing protein
MQARSALPPVEQLQSGGVDPSPLLADAQASVPLVGGRFVAPVLVLLATGLFVILAVLAGAAIHYDLAEAVKSRRGLQQAFGTAQAAMASTIIDYASWDDAVTHLVDRLDAEWADRNIGVYLGAIHQITTSLVIDRDGSVVYASQNGKSLPEPEKWEPLSPALLRMAGAAQAAPAGRPGPITGLVSVNGMLFLAAASDIRAETGGAVRADGRVLVFMKPLDRPAVLAMAKPLVEEVDILTVRPAGGMASLELPLLEAFSPEGAPPVAWLSWPAPMPALRFLMTLSWFLLPLLLILLGVAFLVLQRVQREALRDMVGIGTLQRAQLRTRHLVDSVPDLLCVLRQGRVDIINSVGCRILGFPSSADVQARPFVDLVSPAGRVAFQRLLRQEQQADDHPERWQILELVNRDGAIVPVELSVQPIGGESEGELVVIARDRRQELARRAQMHAADTRAAVAERAKVHFLANISHELRTPLNAIIGFSAILRDELLGSLGAPQYRDYAVDIHDGGVYLLRLVNDLLDIAKLDAGELELREGWLDIATLLDRCERLMAQKAAERNSRIITKLEVQGLRILGDEVRLKQMLVNLINNAIIYSHTSGEVLVTGGVDPACGDVVIKIVDKGIGMTVEAMRLALEPFAQVDTGFARRQAGAGLGLPLAKGYAEAHGGSLTLQSAPGRGTTVSIRLPASRVQQPVPSVS